MPTPCVCAPQIASKIRPAIEAFTLKSPCILEIPSKAPHHVETGHSHAEASADPASRTPRQRQLRAALSLGQAVDAPAWPGAPAWLSPHRRCDRNPAPNRDPDLTPHLTGAPVRLGAGRHPQAHQAAAGHPRLIWVGWRRGRWLALRAGGAVRPSGGVCASRFIAPRDGARARAGVLWSAHHLRGTPLFVFICLSSVARVHCVKCEKVIKTSNCTTNFIWLCVTCV